MKRTLLVDKCFRSKRLRFLRLRYLFIVVVRWNFFNEKRFSGTLFSGYFSTCGSCQLQRFPFRLSGTDLILAKTYGTSRRRKPRKRLVHGNRSTAIGKSGSYFRFSETGQCSCLRMPIFLERSAPPQRGVGRITVTGTVTGTGMSMPGMGLVMPEVGLASARDGTYNARDGTCTGTGTGTGMSMPEMGLALGLALGLGLGRWC